MKPGSAATALYSIAQIRAIEQTAAANLPAGALMQRAGQAAAKAAWELLPEPRTQARILILAGPGNNGGDAFEAACHLRRAGAHVTLIFFGDASKQPPDARAARLRAEAASVEILPESTLAAHSHERWSLIVDGLYGIGLTRAIDGAQRIAVDTANRLRGALACPLLALDVPSGLHADTGAIVGGGAGIAIRATHTLTFIADKPGLHTVHGRDHAGLVQLARLDIDHTQFPAAPARLNQPALFASLLQPRRHNSHKGSYGDVAVLGGAHGMGGAVILAARAAAHCGAGRVYAGFLEHPPPYDSVQPELMCRLAMELPLEGMTLAAGPGLGTSRAAHDLLARTLNVAAPLVLDADALNLLALEPGLQQKVRRRSSPALLTPHPLEATRLLAVSSDEVQSDRPAAARELARRLNAVVILKGSGTVIADAAGDIAINPTGNPGLATAGSGDVLTGICGALLAQGYPAWEAALAATWLHGRAADLLVEQGIGPVGLVAGELVGAARAVLNQLIAERASAPSPARGSVD
jgi:hydroxyethylthiazole kinase-like uncharacterized protein yjeF